MILVDFLLTYKKKDSLVSQLTNGKNFALIYARPCLARLLPAKSYECLCLLCEIVQLIVQPVITTDEIATLYRLLHNHHKLFKTTYGKWEVSVNYHMALHIY